MTWRLFEWTFKLKSPLYIGFHKVLHFYRTRPYVPANIIWAALTAKFTPLLGVEDYQKIGNLLKKAMRFGYLYIYDDQKLYIPKYTEDGLYFNSLSQYEFEKKFITSIATAAIDAQSLTAEEGMLHEVEVISPYRIDNGEQVHLRGFVWIREISENEISIHVPDNGFMIKYKEKELKLNVDFQLQLGGERRSGFGLVRLKEIKNTPNFSPFYGDWKEENEEVIISMNLGQSIWAHVVHNDSLKIKGYIEPLVSRDWDIQKGAGRKLTSYGLFWSPGSILIEDRSFKITELGFWEVIDC